ncbi:MAG: TonB-dependent receptor, partial [Maribacter sp.]|uniref:TonB-dependent receptor domain-containing protein n=1 Tax=Maribacter sp. TaxID=1897614 RepID=UPI003C7895D9
LNSKSLFEWVNFKNNKIQRVKTAYLYERYRYYQNKENDLFTYGKAESFIVNYDLKYELQNAAINGIIDYHAINGQGTSIQRGNRNLFATTVLFTHNVAKRLSYGINLRKDWVNDYKSPFVFAFDGKYEVSNSYAITINTSKNFRIPTFNDLYWEGSAMGNSDLKPETAVQGEVGQVYAKKGIRAQFNLFYISSKDLIQWRPDNSGIWSPVNVQTVEQYGLEASLGIEHKFEEHTLENQVSYAFTRAGEKENKNQLIYVPKHKVTHSLAYRHRKWGVVWQSLYNGKVFTTTDNQQDLNAYFLANYYLDYDLPKIFGASLKTTLQINNLFNTKYQNVAFRPMPNRNIQIQLNFKF